MRDQVNESRSEILTPESINTRNNNYYNIHLFAPFAYYNNIFVH